MSAKAKAKEPAFTPFAEPETWTPTLRERVAWIWEFWGPNRGFLILLFLLTLISSAVAIAYPLVFRHVLDLLAGGVGADDLQSAVRGTVPPETLSRILGILGLIVLGRFIAKFYPAFRAWVNLRLDIGMRTKVFSSILDKDHHFFSRFRTGDLSTRLMDDITEYPKLAWFSCSGVFRALESGSKLVFCVGTMFLLDPQLTLLSVLPLPAMLALIYRLRMRLRLALLDQQQAISTTNDMLESTFSGIRIVKAFAAEAGPSHHLNDILTNRIDVQFRVRMLFALVDILDTVASRVGQLVVLAVGGVSVVQGELSLGTLYAFYIYLDMLVEPMIDLPNLFVTSRQAFVCMDREEEVLRFPSGPAAQDEGSVSSALPPAALSTIELDGVDFSYEGRAAQLQSIDLELSAGETVAVVGEVGSGKSTLLSVLAGLLIPVGGSIRVNGQSVQRAELEGYRSMVGYVPQQPILFSESIRENIEMGREAPGGVDRDSIEGGRQKSLELESTSGSVPEALHITRSPDAAPSTSPALDATLAKSPREDSVTPNLPVSSHTPWARQLLTWVRMETEVERMRHGDDTVLGQKGTGISGGQRQRLSIARALHGRPKLLLLDDCTASLDAENEDRLWDGLRAATPDAIVVLCSHRLATVRRADRIVVMEDGRIAGSGSHDELLESVPAYRRFVQRGKDEAASSGAVTARG